MPSENLVCCGEGRDKGHGQSDHSRCEPVASTGKRHINLTPHVVTLTRYTAQRNRVLQEALSRVYTGSF